MKRVLLSIAVAILSLAALIAAGTASFPWDKMLPGH